MRKRSFLLVASACLAALSLTTGSALADPDPPQPPFRAIQLVGSDTSQEVMNAYANGVPGGFTGVRDTSGNLLISSWDANPDLGRIPETFNTAECQAPPATGDLPRPNGSTAGVDALLGLLAGFPQNCTNAARSSNNDSGPRPPGLTYIPFALDGVTYSTLNQSQVPVSFTDAELDIIYLANGTPGSEACNFLRPLAPQAGSGTLGFWRGLHPFGSCVRQTDPACVTPTNPAGNIQEHSGCWAQGPGADIKLFPFGVGPWIAQSTNPLVTDRRVDAILRSIDGLHPFDLPTFRADHTRVLFNVVRNADATTPNFLRAFGSAAEGGQICSNPAVVRAFGLEPRPTDCGSRAITS